ncbi:MAG: hypothetical protein QOK21_427 [Solirubrobacteraceae bacterium]|nr:hypothetical protein [Solirubrobacteraceae bacterium]
MTPSRAEIERAVRASWTAASCDPVDLPDWSPANAARGQCGATALVVQDLLGGELLEAEVRNADGSHQGVHYWNRLAGGEELDLTREQFAATEVVQAPVVVERPPDLSRARTIAQYRALAAAVRSALSPAAAAPAGARSSRPGS